ncbi:uncharacterized protein CPUR_06841 [Claviceps purpurea 20.1]|uniref:HAT C-terminal dimerisation domain-containing protein n=1 Tax=Claviceps purpurea (strain 20.1) TaxID=1111077 RepID=M1WEE4_CLAP2|nr:uncharacterized protein CPUR_06841 [Claviceps purpurea 20.1]
MSDDCERLFSSAKMLLSDRRSRSTMDIIEACECLRQWLGVFGKEEKELRALEKKAFDGAQADDFSENDEFYDELINDDESEMECDEFRREIVGEFGREVVDDDESEME